MKQKTYTSKVIAWKTGKGYGFLAHPDGGPDLFLHINDIRKKRIPDSGDTVRFQLKKEASGKIVVSNAQLVKFNALSTLSWTLTLILIGFPYLLSLLTLSRSPLPLILYSTMGPLCFLMMRSDKHRAEQGRWRIADDSIHLAQLLWGWPGTLLAQKIYFHKAHKKGFQGTLHFILFIHVIGWVDYMALDHLLLKLIIKLLQYLASL